MNLSHNNNWANGLVLLLISTVITLIVSCQGVTLPGEINQTLPTVQPTATVTPVTVPAVVTTPTLTATNTLENEGLTLTFWTIEAISPQAPAELGSFMAGSLRTFEANNPAIKVNLLLKKPGGKGGVLDFLRTAREAAPAILPDVAIINATDLNQAYTDGLLQTLDNRLDRSIVQDLLPAARKMGTVNERLVGVPISLEMEHTIYNTSTFTTTPILWSDVLSSNTRYLFPAKGTNGLINDATLAQYFSTEGSFHNDQDTLQIDDRVLQRVLTFYQQALEIGVIDPAILEAATSEELWPLYLEDQAGLTQISVRQYLTDRETLTTSTFTSLPLFDKDATPVTITHGWVLVLITDDLERQRAALRLIEWFLSTSNNATWNKINNSIPSRDTAFQQLAGNDPYWVFLNEQLNTAQPQPGFAGYDQLGRIFQQAVEQVIRGEATPEEATATAMDALAP